MACRLPVWALLLLLGWPLLPGAQAEPEVPRVGESVRAARRLLRGDDRAGAIAVLERASAPNARSAEESWLLAGLRMTLWQNAIAQREAFALPRSDLRAALLALLAEDARPALTWLNRSRRGTVHWSDLSAALLLARLGRDDEALGRAQAAVRGTPPALVALEAHHLRARILVDQGKLPEADQEAQRALARDPSDARLHALRGEIHRRLGDWARGMEYHLAALRAAPASEPQARRMADLLREPSVQAQVAGLAPTLAELSGLAPQNAELLALRARVAALENEPGAAVSLYEAALASGAVAVPIDRELRRLLAQAGRWGEVIGLLLGAVPPAVQQDPQNLLHAHWQWLREQSQEQPVGEPGPAQALRLARALIGVGALPEAVCALQSLESAQSAELTQPWVLSQGRALQERVVRHLAFEQALRERVESGYRVAHADGEAPSFDSLLAQLPALARQHLATQDQAAFARPAIGRREMPLLGAWLDHHTLTASPVVAHFRSMGRFLMLGQRSGQPPEAIVLSLASLQRNQEIRVAGRLYHHDVAVGYDREARSFLAAQGGDLGGACLADGIWLDVDSARRTELLLRRLLVRDPALLPAVQNWTPPPATGAEGVLTLGDPGPLAFQLMDRVFRRNGADPWASFSTLRAHEFSHVADINRHLPLMAGLPATLLLLAKAGFSPDRVEMELERRAQLGSVARAADPDLALAEMVEMLPLEHRSPEPHAGGYRQGLRDLVRIVYARPDLFPGVDRTRRILPQLGAVDLEALRQAAAALSGPGRIEPW